MTEDKSLSDKAKEAAEIAKEAAIKAKEKVTEVVGENEDKIVSAIEKTGTFVDEKITKGRFTEKIDKAQDVAKSAVGKIAASAPGSEEGDGTPDAGSGPASPGGGTAAGGTATGGTGSGGTGTGSTKPRGTTAGGSTTGGDTPAP